MFMNFKNFANELDMYNEIVNATERRDYAPTTYFDLDGYYVKLNATYSEDDMLFVLRATDDGCAIYPVSVNYEGQHIIFKSGSVSFEELVKCIDNFFCEVDGE